MRLWTGSLELKQTEHTWPLASVIGSWMAGISSFGTEKGCLAPGGHAGCPHVSSEHHSVEINLIASAIPLDGAERSIYEEGKMLPSPLGIWRSL